MADVASVPPVPAARPRPISGLRALVVDEDADARELLALTLTSAGAVAIVAGSVGEAIRLLEVERPDLLLTDVGMPEENGLQLIRNVRALPPESGGRIPAIAVTAYASSSQKEMALRAGFDSHVVKPYDAETLVAVIAEIASHAR
jgi:CheY-like chemotaxis protein